MAHPRLTIGLPIYNGAPTLRRALDRALAQTFRDFRLIASDNASTDETVAILQEYAASDARIIVDRRPQTVPPTENFVGLLSKCDTEFFVWLADDDWWEPTFVERCAERLDGSPAAIACFTAFRSYYHWTDGYSERMCYLASTTHDPRLNYLTRITNQAPCAIYGVYRAPALRDILRGVDFGNDLGDVTVTLGTTLVNGKVEIVDEDLFRSGIRSEAALRRQSLRGGNVRYLRFARAALSILKRAVGTKTAIVLAPYVIKLILDLRSHNRAADSRFSKPAELSFLTRDQITGVKRA
jgi:glycosyltransferase involved in cell wall biosynthesis